MGGRKGRAGKVKLWIAPDDLKAELAAIEAEAIGWQPLRANRGQTTVCLGFDPCPSASEQLRHP